MESDFFIVGIGASAGGEAALYDLFTNIPHPINAAFIIVLNQKRDHQSQLKFLLSRHTKYPIYVIRDGEEVKPESIYLIPENTVATIKEGRLYLQANDEDSTQNTVDDFFISLAQDRRKRGIGIILSGMGTDGMNGASAIQEYGGIVMVQKPGPSESHSVTSNLIEADFPDYLLPIRNMGMSLSDYINSWETKTNSGLKT